MEICGHTGREYDTNNPSMGCGGEIDLAEEDVMMVGAISFCVLCYENLSEADQEWVATEEETCGADLDECTQCHAKELVSWEQNVGFTIGDCEGCGLMLCRKCMTNCQTCSKE